MTFVSVTRLRIRSLRFLPAFAVHAVRTRNQVRAAPGFLGGALLPDRNRTFRTLTSWTDQAQMRRYILDGAHRRAMPNLIRWCDEASVVHWTRAEPGLPTWAEADRRMRAEGRPSKVRHPSPEHAAMAYRAPEARRIGLDPPGHRAERRAQGNRVKARVTCSGRTGSVVIH